MSLELWGGVECSIVRIGDSWRDQIRDLDLRLDGNQWRRLREMGMRRLRFPVLWESVAPDDPARCDWSWHDEHLAGLREDGPAPIAGLIHHGSGPRYTSLLDPRFPQLLADHAARVAERYPWIDAYTPVNEPVTTARFSALYGHWYPHARDERSFLQALVHQCKATVLAMAAIRRIRPSALLIQTDDLGKTFATRTLQYQAAFENERRWIGYDLLHGRVNGSHRLYGHLLRHGVAEADLAFFLENPCAPDILGFNHYLTGERYLDENLKAYPSCFHGGNGRQTYADVEAVRVSACADDVGPYARLKEAWERYRRPIAITEAHHGCSRDEQLRWLVEVWQGAQRLRDEGADVRAVTLWSLYGAMDWNTLLTRRAGHYEPGAFDARCSPARPTALSRAAASLARTGRFDHPVLDAAGWWRREGRFYAPRRSAAGVGSKPRPQRRLLITGATGTLGRAFARVCMHRGLDHVLLTRREMDIADEASVAAALARYRPWAVINAAGYVRVDEAERERERCFRENAEGPAVLAAECARLRTALVSFSSDLVFDGALGRPYIETDAPQPLTAYGMSKAQAEALVMQAHPASLLVRTSAFFGPWDRHNFVYRVVDALLAGRPVAAHDDAIVSPTYVPDLVHATLDLLVDGEHGIWHLANEGAVSWYQLAMSAAEEMRLGRTLIERSRHPRPGITALRSARGSIMPPLDGALTRYFRDNEVDWRPLAAA